MLNRLLLFLLATAFLSACVKDSDAEPKTADFNHFTLVLPAGWTAFSLQGYDSQVGGVTDGRDTLSYDYGGYSYNFQRETAVTHNRATFTIDGRPALLVQPKQTGQGVIGLYVEVDGLIRFNLYGQDIQDETTAVAIMRSVKFK